MTTIRGRESAITVADTVRYAVDLITELKLMLLKSGCDDMDVPLDRAIEAGYTWLKEDRRIERLRNGDDERRLCINVHLVGLTG